MHERCTPAVLTPLPVSSNFLGFPSLVSGIECCLHLLSVTPYMFAGVRTSFFPVTEEYSTMWGVWVRYGEHSASGYHTAMNIVLSEPQDIPWTIAKLIFNIAGGPLIPLSSQRETPPPGRPGFWGLVVMPYPQRHAATRPCVGSSLAGGAL